MTAEIHDLVPTLITHWEKHLQEARLAVEVAEGNLERLGHSAVGQLVLPLEDV